MWMITLSDSGKHPAEVQFAIALVIQSCCVFSADKKTRGSTAHAAPLDMLSSTSHLRKEYNTI